MIANINNIEQVYNELPDAFVFENVTFHGYKMCEDLHFQHGWREVVIPTISSTQKLSENYILKNDVITKEVIEMSIEEINEKKEQEIEVIRQQTSLAISEYMREHKERFIFRQIEIPQYAWDKYDEMRAEFHVKKQAILNR